MSYADPARAPNPTTDKEEGTGIVTSDSLAAESIRKDGSFASGDATYNQVPSHAATTAATDTQGATELPPGRDAAARDNPPSSSYRPPGDPRAAPGSNIGAVDQNTGAAYPPGGNPSSGGGYDTSRGGPQAAHGGAAPGYVAGDVTRDNPGRPRGDLEQPKGKNITEGGFDANAPNASFIDAEQLGTRKDPGRAGVDEAVKTSARSGADAGYEGAGQTRGADGGGGKGGFENLDEERA